MDERADKPDALEQRLAEMTRADDHEPALWAKALEQEERRRDGRVFRIADWLRERPIAGAGIGAAAAAAVTLVFVLVATEREKELPQIAMGPIPSSAPDRSLGRDVPSAPLLESGAPTIDSQTSISGSRVDQFLPAPADTEGDQLMQLPGGALGRREVDALADSSGFALDQADVGAELDETESAGIPLRATAPPPAEGEIGRGERLAFRQLGVDDEDIATNAQEPMAEILAKTADEAPARVVAYATSMRLQAERVETAFEKAKELIDEDAGEFVEASSIIGEREQRRAALTLRVAPARQEAVLTQLQELGETVDLRQVGSDITDQLVDLGARVSNERVMEQEMLELVEQRKHANVDEVIDLRDKLGSTRETIERLEARQLNLQRRADLARIDLTIEPADAEDPEEQSSLDLFLERIGGAWSGGLDRLGWSLAWAAEVLVSGSVWIIAAGVGLWVALIRWRANRCAW